VFADSLFWQSMSQAVVWTLLSTLFQTILGVGIALLLHQTIFGIAFFRGLLLFPYIVPTVVIALIWRWIFNPEIGVVNYGLQAAGIIDAPIYWLSTPTMAMASTIMLNVWKYTPFVVICVLARLQTVPLELYDAAKVDGARAIRRFFDVTLPQLREVLIVVVVFRTIWTFNKFEEIYLLTKGGPGTSTFNLAIYSFEQSMANLKLGVGAATGVVMMVMLLIGSVIYLRVAGFGREE
jgi:ABC-type sugar transport system permease subunit